MPTRTHPPRRWNWLFAALAALVLVQVASMLGRAQESLAAIQSEIGEAFPDVPWIEPEALDALASPPLLLDAREAAEFEVSHLRGAVRIDPEHPDLSVLEDVPAERTVVVYCSVGYRSAMVARTIQHSGRNRVFNLRGGIFGWANAGRPMVTEQCEGCAPRTVQRAHPYDRRWGQLLEPSRRAPLR